MAAWADPRGRVRALFRVVPEAERWLLVTSADLVPALLAKLRLFVLRADVKIEHAPELAVFALVGGADPERLPVHLPAEPHALANACNVHWIRAADTLCYAVGEEAAVRAACKGLDEAPATLAELAAIRCGLPAVDAALAEKFIPQMLNLDALGAVSFDKGCYPGQEVVARTHHRGAVKRRLRRFAAAGAALPARGTRVLGADGDAAGEVLRAAPADEGIELLAVARLDAAPETLALDGFGVALRELPLPYPITSRA